MGGKAQGGRRVDRAEGLEIFSQLEKRLYQEPSVLKVELSGSLGRGVGNAGDIDVLVVVREPIDRLLVQMFGFQQNGKPAKSGLVNGIQVDFFITDEDGYAGMWLFAQGPAEKNIQMRSIAKSRGLMLNEKGLFNRETKERVAKTVEEIEEMLS